MLPAGPEQWVISLGFAEIEPERDSRVNGDAPVDVLLWAVRLFIRRNTSPSQSSQNQQASSWNWRPKYKMRYKAQLLYPEQAVL